METPYSIVLPANDPEIVKSFEDAKVTLRVSAGVPYEELVRHVLQSVGLNYKIDGVILRIVTVEQQPEIWTKTFRISKKEYEALGMLDHEGNINRVKLRKWLDTEVGEVSGYSEKRKTFTISAHRHKVEALNALLSLHRLGYKIPILYSKLKNEEIEQGDR